ncbi:MAG: NAD(P)H-dependent flavin oxidoreductase [Burkholderiales bacterium]
MKTRITALLGIEHPIIQAGMSWASSSSALVIAVSNAGGLGTIAAGPMRPDAFRQALDEIRAGTRNPWAVNVPLYNPRAAEFLDIAFEARCPVMIGSQGSPKAQLARFQGIGCKWLHVVTTLEHAQKAEAAGVDALVAVGVEAGGHPAPSEVSTLVLVRRLAKACRIPVIASGGVADGAGIAALLALGADGVELGTRFIATPEATVHVAYKQAVLAAGIGDTSLVARGRLPIRQIRNAFSARYDAAERAGAAPEALEAMFKSSSLKQAALDGDIDEGKLEAGQSAGLVEDIVPAAELMRRLVAETEQARARLAAL